MAKKIDQVVPEIIDSVDGLNAKMNAMRRKFFLPIHRSR